jgi:hypothetical protein
VLTSEGRIRKFAKDFLLESTFMAIKSEHTAVDCQQESTMGMRGRFFLGTKPLKFTSVALRIGFRARHRLNSRKFTER